MRADDDEDRFLHANIEEICAYCWSTSTRMRLPHPSLMALDIFTRLSALSDKTDRLAIFIPLAHSRSWSLSRDVCWEIDCTAHLVIVMGTQFYEGREHRYIDYPISEVLQMFGKGRAPRRQDQQGPTDATSDQEPVL